MRFLKTLLATPLALVPFAAQPATVSVTIGAPGATSADWGNIGATGLIVERFDSLDIGPFYNVGSTLGTYSRGRVDPTNQFGGSGGSQYLFSASHPGTLLTLTSDAKYFGFWWSAGSVANRVELFSNGESVFSFTTNDVLDFLTNDMDRNAGYFGNPNNVFKGRVAHEPFVFLNMFSDTSFDSILFSGPNFESDNHTIATGYSSLGGTNIAPVPLPASLWMLFVAVAAGAAVARRQTG